MTSLPAIPTRTFVDKIWNDSILPTLVEYIKIPNKSPHFDPQWHEHGHMDRAVDLLVSWAKAHPLPGMSLEVVRMEGRTPVIFIEIPGVGDAADDTVVLYGHLDKQPEMTGWDSGKGPWIPVLEDGKLYGRGGADDGYALFASLTAIHAVHEQKAAHARCVVLIEACEESGSYDLPHYIDKLAERIGEPSLVVCLDSGCGNYDQMWITTSLRGLVIGELRVDILKEGVHSGDASGIVPSSFRILRQVLSRIEDPETGAILLEEIHAKIPEQRVVQATKVAETLGSTVWKQYPFVGQAQPMGKDLGEMALNRTWYPTLSITGIDGMPALSNAGNVLRPYTTAKLSFRIPPSVDAAQAGIAIKKVLEANPPYQAKVEFQNMETANGWDAPPVAAWLEEALSSASKAHFGAEVMYMGEGGSIPFMGMLGKKFPKAQFAITGVLGPASNAHGPNEFLHIETARRLTCCIAEVLVQHAQRKQ
jgi:acetylornithine deacetylase/succinyl-diaminopimelate desuccinylase-like protein